MGSHQAVPSASSFFLATDPLDLSVKGADEIDLRDCDFLPTHCRRSLGCNVRDKRAAFCKSWKRHGKASRESLASLIHATVRTEPGSCLPTPYIGIMDKLSLKAGKCDRRPDVRHYKRRSSYKSAPFIVDGSRPSRASSNVQVCARPPHGLRRMLNVPCAPGGLLSGHYRAALGLVVMDGVIEAMQALCA